MSKGFEVRICLYHQLKTGKVRIAFWDPIGRKEIKAGVVVGPDPDDIAREVKKHRTMIERAGHWVSFADLTDRP